MTCQEYWAPEHRCAAGKAHYIEVFLDDEEEDEEEQDRGHNPGIEGDDPPPPIGEDGVISPIRGTLASLGVVPNYHKTSTQETYLNFHSGSRDMMIPSIMHMRMVYETSLSCGKPPGRPPNPDLVRYVLHHDAPFIDPRGMGAL